MSERRFLVGKSLWKRIFPCDSIADMQFYLFFVLFIREYRFLPKMGFFAKINGNHLN